MDGVMKLQQLVEWLRDEMDKVKGEGLKGVATIAQGQTTLIIAHNLGTPTYSLALTPTSDPGGRYWASNKTATQFQANLQTAAPVGGVSFDWIIRSA
jgi:hypothetical protein